MVSRMHHCKGHDVRKIIIMTGISAEIVTLLCFCVCVRSLSFSLDHLLRDGTWTAKNENGTYKVPAAVPGGIYTDLSAAGVLTQDIYYRYNDINYRWVSHENWIYSRIFDIPADFMQMQEINLVLHGVDTVASVFLNSHHVGDCDNMFVRYNFPIKSYLKSSSNKLKIKLQSPISAAKKRFDRQRQKYVVPPECVPPSYHGECHVNHLRKMQASFSWDWGPAFPSVGLWKNIQVEAFNTAVLRDVTIHTEETDNQWLLHVNMFLDGGYNTTQITGLFSATIDLVTHKIKEQKNETIISCTPGDFHTNLVIRIPKTSVKLWWPNGFGSQNLYNLTVKFSDGNSDKSERTIKVGFRNVELVQEAVKPGSGLTFYLKVNNVPVFAKGSNWIPSHILPEKSADQERLEHLMQSAKSTHMNVLRVWGGGFYESDLFYKLADEMGILVWQDFLFACSMYPTNPSFLQSVSVEVKQQVRRLQHHASLVIWAGNNENEGALRDNWYGTSSNFSLYKRDYIKLYVDTIQHTALAEDSTHAFVISSPSNGIESEQEGYIAENPSSSFYGDIHYYNYLSDGWNPNTYKYARFSSEYGFQSWPSLISLQEVSEHSDWSISSEFADHRQHHPGGNAEIKTEIQLNLQLPENTTAVEQFPIFIYLSQINQAMSIKTETEFYRRSRSLHSPDGIGLTMGALYWQLNDIWQAPSWASIEFNGRWKMLHYFAKDFFAPVLVSPLVSSAGDLEVHLISDYLQDLQTVLTVYVYKWSSLAPLYTLSSNQTLQNSSATKVFTCKMDTFLQSAGCGDKEPAKRCFLYFTLKTFDGVNISPNNFLFPGPLKGLVQFTQPNITVTNIELSSDSESVYNISLKTDKIALFVWIEAYNILGSFSQNGFIMVTSTMNIEFTAKQNVTVHQLKKAITVVSLADFY